MIKIDKAATGRNQKQQAERKAYIPSKRQASISLFSSQFNPLV